jgi:hypothetical protein
MKIFTASYGAFIEDGAMVCNDVVITYDGWVTFCAKQV